MRVKRKFIANQAEIDELRNHNASLFREYAGQQHVPQVKLPDPIYKVYDWSFRVFQLNSFYVEREYIDSSGRKKKIPEGEGDIVAGILYEGIIRLQYCPIVESKFNLALNGD